MRIRKNAKLSSLLDSHASSAPLETTFQSHVCQLNQSPWDVVPFGSVSNELEDEDNFAGINVSRGDSIAAFESVASMMDTDQNQTMPEVQDMLAEDNHTLLLPPHPPLNNRIQKSTVSRKEDHKHSKSFISCKKTDGKGWHCKKEAKPGQSFCDHHYALLKSYSNSNNNGNGCQSKKSTAATAAAARRAGAREASKKSSSSNSYEFYYYSGFGPSWGKRRGESRGRKNSKIDDERTDDNGDGRRADAVAVNANGRVSSSSNPSSSSQIDNDDEFDNCDGDEDEDENEDEDEASPDICRKKKRVRKPGKSRSLKSLM